MNGNNVPDLRPLRRARRRSQISEEDRSREYPVEISDFRARLERLALQDSTPISAISPDLKRDIQELIPLLRLSADKDPASLQIVRNEIYDVFKTSTVIPGTVGGFIRGCLLTDDKENCKLICGEIDSNGNCTAPIYVVSTEKVRKISDGKGSPVIYVEEGLSVTDAKKKLEAEKIRNGTIITYSNGRYQVLEGTSRSARTTTSSSTGIIILVVIIVIILLAVGGYYLYRKSKSGGGESSRAIRRSE